jgi:hypothetical protein
MTIVHRIPASKPGDFLCEVRGHNHLLQRRITTSEREAQQLERAGATIWVGRFGGWIRKG